MTPNDFIEKWKAVELKERSAAQEHFLDLCRLLDEPTPAEADPRGEFYCFERGASKTTGGEGWADVWKRGHFGWEYKGKRRDLTAAFAQLQQYAVALENPPLLVVCDMDRFEIHTNWTNTVSVVHEIALEDLRDSAVRDTLKAVFSDPDRLKPGKTREALTEEAAGEFARLARRLRAAGYAPDDVAHFINRLLFCMFAEDIGLLPNKMFMRMLEHAQARPEDFQAMAADLFEAMRTGGRIGFEAVEWFNGGLFDDNTALPLDREEVGIALRAAQLDWSEIDPSIFGTLFERGLDPDKRSQLGAHYTDRDKIMMIIEPVVIRPWLEDWKSVKPKLVADWAEVEKRPTKSARVRAVNRVQSAFGAFLDRLRSFVVLDPACGSGNFLYLALRAMKDVEHRVMLEAEAIGLGREFPKVGPQNVKGIEINPYAAELARVTVWIGEIQWMMKNGFDASRNPILKPLDNIECRDAVLAPDGSQAEWPEADAIVGNPPFLGDKMMIGALGEEYVAALRRAYAGLVRGGADLVLYWFARAGEALRCGRSGRIGLVATNSIRGGANRLTLAAALEGIRIFDAWSDLPWVVEGAAVRVSLVCADRTEEGVSRLNGAEVSRIYSDLTAQKIGGALVDLTEAQQLPENSQAFIGDQKSGAFDIQGDLARQWLQLPSNPNGRPNSDVLRPWQNGMDVTRRPAGRWIVDFGPHMTEADAALYEAPFALVVAQVRPQRSRVRRGNHRRYWWRHGEARPGMRRALESCARYIVTPRVAKHRLFVWLHASVLPDCQLVVIAREDDTIFGILHSRLHEAWSLRMGTSLEDRPRYTPSTTFETFPFPEGLTPDLPAASYAEDPRAIRIAAAAARLNELRETWLNPPDLVQRVPEVVPGYPDRLLPIDEKAAEILKRRTLTNLYNERPAWLNNAHRDLDTAVAAAYGWPEDIGNEEALAELFALNQERAARA